MLFIATLLNLPIGFHASLKRYSKLTKSINRTVVERQKYFDNLTEIQRVGISRPDTLKPTLGWKFKDYFSITEVSVDGFVSLYFSEQGAFGGKSARVKLSTKDAALLKKGEIKSLSGNLRSIGTSKRQLASGGTIIGHTMTIDNCYFDGKRVGDGVHIG